MAELEDTKAPPALFEHCVTTYRTMLKEAKAVTAQGDLADINDTDGLDDYDDNQIIVYEGFFTRLITSELNLSVPYYTAITKRLVEMGCIRQLKRGGGTSPSQWELIYEPTLDAFMKAQPKKSKRPSKDAAMQEQIDNLNHTVSELATTVDTVLEALAIRYGTEEVKEA